MDAIGFGALNVDRIYLVEEIPKVEEESYVIESKTYSGGSSANTISALAKLGLRTGFIGKVGRDEDGKFLIEDLKGYGVDTRSVIVSEGKTGYAMVFVDRKGNRAIILDPAVNDTIKFDEIDFDYVSNFKLLHISSFVCKTSWDSFKSQEKIVREFGGIVSFDPGNIYAKFGFKKIIRLVENADIFMPNEVEVKILTGLDYKEGAEYLLNWCRVVVVKRGDRGCYVTDGEGSYEIPAFETEVVDTTGAGDAFNAGFLYGYLKGKDLKECAKLGNYLASLCIRNVGAKKYLDKRYLHL